MYVGISIENSRFFGYGSIEYEVPIFNHYTSHMQQFIGLRSSSTNISQLTNEELFSQCREYGARAIQWKNKFTGLLGEVHKRKLFIEKGFGTIYEFAGKLAGVSHA